MTTSKLLAGVAVALAGSAGCGGPSPGTTDAPPTTDAPQTADAPQVPDATQPTDAPQVPDAMVPDATQVPDAMQVPDATPLPPGVNHVFVTSTPITGEFGGLAGADAICNAEAAAAGIPGTYVAWLSSSTVNARDRLGGGSRGWVRVDGLPVLDTVDEMIATNRMFNPPWLDASGMRVLGLVWTGTTADGLFSPGQACSDWSPQSFFGLEGWIGSSMPDLTESFENYCIGTGRLLCFELGKYGVVAPTPPADNHRLAFISTTKRTAPGLAHLDAICAGDAAAAGLPGTYLAAVPTSTASVASRFVADQRPWRRPDGTLIAGPELLTAIDDYYTSFINQHADGTYTSMTTLGGASDPTQVAAPQDTCNNWASVSAGYHDLAAPYDTGAFWAAFGFIPCSYQASVLCLQE